MNSDWAPGLGPLVLLLASRNLLTSSYLSGLGPKHRLADFFSAGPESKFA